MKVLGLILAGEKGQNLGKLTNRRASAAVPVGGKYRAIDFTISNMVRAGVKKISVLTQYNPRSLMDHLGSGREWDLDRKTGGLYILQPYVSESTQLWYRGTADAIHQNITVLRRGDEDYILIGSGDHIYNIDFIPLFREHILSMADVTVITKMKDDYDTSFYGVVKTDESGRIIDFKEKEKEAEGDRINLGIYFVNKKLLMDLLYSIVPGGKYDLVKDILIPNLSSLKIMAYDFAGYWKNIKKSIIEYKKTNMDMLDPEISKELFSTKSKIFTKLKDLAPPKITSTGSVKNSIIADGCIIAGKVSNSVLFRNVKIRAGAIIDDSIVMEGSTVEEGARLTNCILDKNVTIRTERTYVGYDEPLVFEKWQVV
uniref:Glucose-1-phosphate adenylyltransferase subunit GlgD n=1 Tax=Mesoaciditoga lauensis TaxID=1495039 RepID=A0A7V3RFB7_9BACT